MVPGPGRWRLRASTSELALFFGREAGEDDGVPRPSISLWARFTRPNPPRGKGRMVWWFLFLYLSMLKCGALSLCLSFVLLYFSFFLFSSCPFVFSFCFSGCICFSFFSFVCCLCIFFLFWYFSLLFPSFPLIFLFVFFFLCFLFCINMTCGVCCVFIFFSLFSPVFLLFILVKKEQ